MLYENLKRICAEKGLTFARLERELDFGNGTLAKWKSSIPSVDRVAKVASRLGVTVDELWEDEKK